MIVLRVNASQLACLLQEKTGAVLLRAICRDHLGDFFRLQYSEGSPPILVFDIGFAGGCNVKRRYLVHDDFISGKEEIQDFLEWVTTEHQLENVSISELKNIEIFFDEIDSSVFASWNTTEFLEPKEFLFPWAHHQLAEVTDRFLEYKLPKIYLRHFQTGFLSPFRNDKQFQTKIMVDALLSAGVTLSIAHKSSQIFWMNPGQKDLYKFSAQHFCTSNTFFKLRNKTIQLNDLLRGNVQGCVFNVDIDLNPLTEDNLELIYDSLISYLELKLSETGRSKRTVSPRLKRVLRQAVGAVKIINIQESRLVVLPAFGRAFSIPHK